MADLIDGRADPPRSGARFVAFAVTTGLVLAALGGRLFQLQVLQGDLYATRAAASRTAELPIRASRGLIFDRWGRPLAVNLPSWTVQAVPAELPEAPDALLRLVGALTGTPVKELRQRLEVSGGSPYEAVSLVRGIDRKAALLIAERRAELPGIVIEVEAVRQYLDASGQPNGWLLSHVVGYVGPISPEELLEREGDGYPRDGVIGKAGIEGSFESDLRGSSGAEIVERDPAGRAVRVVETLRQPTPGKNLVLTIDADLQQTATDALRWGMEAAGVDQGVTVVMNPQTGEILAMVSLPAYDNNKFATGIGADDFAIYLSDPGLPLRNHAIADHYPPGSTFKLVTAMAALEEGVTSPTRRWPTYACYQIPGAPTGECLSDWNRRGFGALNISEAFSHSSDTFFYQMAIEAGIDQLATWAHELGFGSPTGIGLPGEAGGIVASTRWAEDHGRSGLFTGEVAQAGIGQGLIAVTPLQLLNAYAALANGGNLMRPMIVRGVANETGELVSAYAPEVLRLISVDPNHQRVLRLAAREVVTSGHAYNIRDLPLPGALSGKTGTAEFGVQRGDGNLPYHSWFVAYLPSVAGATDAELAVATFTYSASVRGNVSVEVVKYFLQMRFDIERDYRLDPRTVRLLDAN